MSPTLGGRSLNFYESFDSVNDLLSNLKLNALFPGGKNLPCFESTYVSCFQSIFQLEICIYLLMQFGNLLLKT